MQCCNKILIKNMCKPGLRLNAAKCKVAALDCEDVPVVIEEEQVKEAQNLQYLGNVVSDMEVNIGQGFDGDRKKMIQG